MKQQIQFYFQDTFPDRRDVQVSEPERIATGWETEIFSFDVDYTLSGRSIHENIIMRMFPGEDSQRKSEIEFSAMNQLSAVGYPVPQVYHLEREKSPWGKPFILMEQIKGDIMWPQLVHSPSKIQRALLTQFCELFVQLHQLDWRAFADDMSRYDVKNRYQFIDSVLDQGADLLALFDATGFLPVIHWLQDRRDEVPCDQPAPIHFDFHPANILLRPDGTAVVLDWSGFEISDARFDLAWTMVLVSSYEGAVWREKILQTYERLIGIPVKRIEYFQVYACVRRLAIVIASIQGGAEMMGMAPNAVTLMKQQMFAHQNVYGLLTEKTGIRVGEVEDMFALFS